MAQFTPLPEHLDPILSERRASTEATPLVPVQENGAGARSEGACSLCGAICYGGVLTLVAVIGIVCLGANLFGGERGGQIIEADGGVPFLTTTHPLRPTALWGALTTPYPTGAWYLNLAMENGDQPIGALPYAFKATSDGVGVSYSAVRRKVAAKVMQDVYDSDLIVSAAEKYESHAISRADNLSVTLKYALSGSVHFEAYLVRGSPYATFEFTAATPKIGTNAGVLYLSDETVTEKGSEVRGSQFKLVLGNWETWIVYFSESVTTRVSSSGLKLLAPFSGTVRAALLPKGGPDAATAEGVLNQHSHAHARGGQVSFKVVGNKMTMRYSWDKHGFGDLLMLALPHHVDMMDVTKVDLAMRDSYQSMKGKMTGVVGSAWEMTDNLPTVGWTAKSPLDLSDPAQGDRAAAIVAALKRDITSEIPNAPDIYGFGKQCGRMARLALIAEELGEKSLAQQAALVLVDKMSPWLRNDNHDMLIYDKTWGGVVTYDSLKDSQKDFGNARYDDHHYHLGYFLYAAAVASKLTRGSFYNEFKEPLDYLVLDIANADPANLRFPIARHKDFYDGHSWASGLFSQANGKSQESISEAVNGYYSVVLMGLAAGDLKRTEWGRVLLAMELRSAKKYWQMPEGTPVYDEVYAANRMTGVVASLETVHLTWFGDKYEWVHGINMIPFTPASEELLGYPFMEQEWPVLGTVFERIDDPPNQQWQGYVRCAQAVVEPQEAWDAVQELQFWDDGNSLTNALYWIATRPPPPNGTVYNASDFTFEIKVAPECDDNSACFAQGLAGLCCPSSWGDWLGCCPSYAKKGDASAACAANEGCAKIGLTEGMCCPSNAGYLDCCGAQHSAYNPDTPAACKNNEGCEDLLGDCCPAPGGVYLGCCPPEGSGATNSSTGSGSGSGGGGGGVAEGGSTGGGDSGAASGGGTSSVSSDKGGGASGGGGVSSSGAAYPACTSHTACSGLLGNCCPTDDGVMLGCCSI